MNSGAKSAALSVLAPLLLLALGFSVPLVIRARRAARETATQSAAPAPAKEPDNRPIRAAGDAAGEVQGLRSDAAEVEPLRNDTGWEIFRGDRGLSGVAEGHLPDTLTLRWSFETGDAIKSSPVLGGGRVFIGSNDAKIYALDAATGRKAWEFDTGAAVEAPPLVLENTVYVGNLNGVFYAIDAATGRKRWQFETEGAITGSANRVTAPGDSAKRVVVGSHDNTMYCLNAASGTLVWKYETDNFIN
ncbi:MAG: PQQ-like beta-propeller repeat protein, partial [Planctomycetes bacterium]|nr:PQQ-like beta-propeller repeat protein [Planctomycetota bacterium]